MKVFVSHATSFNFKDELYKPIKNSALFSKHKFLFPHDTDEVFSTKDTIQNICDVVLAEVSFPSTGQGIELGWAEDKKKKVICVYKSGTKPSGSLKIITDTILEYSNTNDLISKISTVLS